MSKSQSVPAHSLYGVPQNNQRLSAISGARIASASAPYVGRGTKCIGNEDTCGSQRAKGTELCIGHLKQSINKTSGQLVSTETLETEE
jgi:5-deoxy-D-glucuronate isomerase